MNNRERQKSHQRKIWSVGSPKGLWGLVGWEMKSTDLEALDKSQKGGGGFRNILESL